jgi:Integrase core domain/leucine-zipper of insertion element IS481
MNAHKNARAMPFGRAVMVRRVLEEVWTVAAVASAFEVSTRTVSKWLARFHRVGHRITGDRPHGSDGAGWSSCMWRSTTSRGPPTSRSCPTRSAPVGHRLPGPRPALVQKPRYPVERAMIDNGSGYVSRLFRKACRMLRLRHLRTRPYTPKTNGKAERFIQTLLREWAYALPYRSSETRAADLPRWLRHYNQERPHASLARQSPTAWLQAHP